MIPYRPERILVQEQARGDALTREILARLAGIPVGTAADAESPLPAAQGSSIAQAGAKRTLLLARYPGRFLKECPGNGAEICCNYYVLNFASNCHLECTYCILQSYLNNPALVVFTNTDNILAEVAETLGRSPRQSFRIGTGELADSLALDDITGYSRLLVPFFGSIPNGLLELKTKSDNIANLEGLEHRGRTVVSWSLNSRRICRSEELKTASFEARLAAARQCRQWGYRLGFHFDPLIYYPGWEEDYQDALRELFCAVDPAAIAWISLGCLRFTPHLERTLRARFPKSKIPYGEFFPGHHGKLRYFRPLRQEMYRKMRSWIRQWAPQVFVYLCMESRVVWEGSFGAAPHDAHELSDQMDSLVPLSSIS